MIQNRGFTFNGIHSSQFNIYCDPSSRILLPEKRRTQTTVPGRSGVYVQEDGAYNSRSESFTCTYTRKPGTDIAHQARDISLWLSKNGVLRFDSEPDKCYDAFFTGALPLTRHLMYGEFSLTFTYSPPFAYTEQQAIQRTLTEAEETVTIDSDATAPTPCRIIIDNTGTTTIQNLRIGYQHYDRR